MNRPRTVPERSIPPVPVHREDRRACIVSPAPFFGAPTALDTATATPDGRLQPANTAQLLCDIF